MRNVMLSCAFASAILSHAAFLCQNAVAGSSEAGQTQTVQAQPRLRLAQNTEAPEKNEPAASRSCLRRRKRTAMGRCPRSPPQQKPRRARKLPSPPSTRRPSPSIPPPRNVANAISKSTMNGRSSQHAYASISPMFHAFEQKFQELTKGTVGTFCVRCHQQVGTQLGENAPNAALGDEPDLARGRELHHLPPGQGAVRQGQRRAPGRAGQDLRAGLRQRREERPQGHPRQQGDLLRQNQQRRAWQQTSTTA